MGTVDFNHLIRVTMGSRFDQQHQTLTANIFASSSLSHTPLRYVFHYMVTDGLTYLCMSDTDFSRPLAFQFLNDIKDRFQATYGDRAKTAIAFAFNADFARVLQAQMEKHNSDSDPKIARIRQQIGEVKDVMMESIDRVLLRGEKIELLVDKTEVLEAVRRRDNTSVG